MSNLTTFDLVVVGGGPAGFFAALRYASIVPTSSVLIVEKTDRVLQKVLISGGGRCNITHDCMDAKELILSYPRGGKSLLNGFYVFGPEETLNWFRDRGLDFYTDEIGCVFPVTDKSQSVIDVLTNEARKLGVQIWQNAGVEKIELVEKGNFLLHLPNDNLINTPQVVIATGGNRQSMKMLRQINIPINDPVPSLFPLKLNNHWLAEYAGLSVEDCVVSIPKTKFSASGTVLITHRGISGPGVIRLSSWAARFLKESDYCTSIHVDWLPAVGNQEQSLEVLRVWKDTHAAKQVTQQPVFPVFASRLWRGFCGQVSGLTGKRWADVSKGELSRLNLVLRQLEMNVVGRDQHKQEYVTCGGVDLKSVSLRTMESKQIPNLMFVGEVLDIDGLTGGYNLQNCWTTGWLAGTSLAVMGG